MQRKMGTKRILITLGAVISAIGLLSLLLYLRPPTYFSTPPNGSAYLFFRDGRIVEAPESWLKEHQWKTFRRPPIFVPWLRRAIIGVLPSARWPVPNPPGLVNLESRMNVATRTGIAFHIHSDFMVKTNGVGVYFEYGGMSRPARLQEVVQADLDGIRTNGITFMSKEGRTVVPAAIVVASDGIKVIPESYAVRAVE